MFSSQKNNPFTISTQSSVDSLVTSRSTSTSVSDVAASQGSGFSSYGEPHSPEQRLGPVSGRRHSVFTLRSRSNTATSTTSFATPSSPNMSGHDASSSRSLFRNKKGKRLSGSFSQQLQGNDQSESQGRRSSVLRKSKKQAEQSEGSAHNLKSLISSPFGFQHLTHTDRHHFASLEDASENELVAGFRAVRASQAPRRDLTGIKAQDLQSPEEEDFVNSERRSISAMELRPPPDFIDHVVEAEEVVTSSENSMRPSLRQTRSVESFSRPGVTARTHRHTQSANAPPRSTSRLPADSQDDNYDTGATNRQSGIWDGMAQLSPARKGSLLPSMAEEPDYVGHALTTPDDSAIHPFTPPFSPALEDVAEEPERFVSPRPAPLPPNMSPKSPRSPRSPTHGSFSYSQRSPVTRSHARRDSHVLPKQLITQNIMRPSAQVSETLVSPGLSRRYSIRKPSGGRRKSNTWRVIEESWEDDIDYIYDNALEAECELDWDETHDDPDHGLGIQAHQQTSAMPSSSSAVSSPALGQAPLSPSLFAGNFRASLLVPNTNSVPELEPRSAVSSSTLSVQTPSDYFHPHGPFAEAGRFSFTPSILGSADGKEEIAREDMYDSLLADYEESDKHFALLDTTHSVASSTRSSHARASKSSYDSSLMSSGHASGSWTTGICRSVGSAASLPDLVHSARGPRPDLPTATDKLSENMSSLAFEDENDEEDDELTPPGHMYADMATSTVSSSRSRTHHKYAASEGAAKLLASNNAPRVRAGSVPQKSRGPSFSLFPNPPRN